MLCIFRIRFVFEGSRICLFSVCFLGLECSAWQDGKAVPLRAESLFICCKGLCLTWGLNGGYKTPLVLVHVAACSLRVAQEGSLQAWILSAVHFSHISQASRAVMSRLLKGISLSTLLGLLQYQLECTDSCQIHILHAFRLFWLFGSKSESLDSFQICFLDICVIVPVQQELAINMKTLNLVVPGCFFVVLDLLNVFWCDSVT